MVLYECNLCNKIYFKKSLYNDHINRKNKCNDKQYKLNCIYCSKVFSTKSSVTRHIKNNCPIVKKNNKDKQIIYDKLIVMQKQIDELKYENNKLKIQTGGNLEKQSKTINNTTNNNTTNHNTINHGIINNITIIAYGSEDIDKINIDQILKSIRGYQTPVYLTDIIHFNPKYPEYHNVYIPSIKDTYAMVFDGNDWKLVQKNELIEELYDNKKEYIEENIEEFSKSLSESKLKALKRWLESDDNGDKCIKKIKKDLELLLYNQRKIPIKTKKLNNS